MERMDERPVGDNRPYPEIVDLRLEVMGPTRIEHAPSGIRCLLALALTLTLTLNRDPPARFISKMTP